MKKHQTLRAHNPMRATLIDQPAAPPGLQADVREGHDVPTWVVMCVDLAETLGYKPPGKPGRLALVALLHVACNAWVAYALTRGLRADGHALLPIDTLGCAIRAELAPLLMCLALCLDFAIMTWAASIRGGFPTLWTARSDQGGLACPHCAKVVQRSLAQQPGFVPFFIPWGVFLVCWLQPAGWGWGLVSILGWVVCLPPQWLLNAVSYDFAATSLDIKQGEFIEDLLSGRFDYTQAVQAYNTINSERRALKRVLSLTSSLQFIIYLASSGVFLYDFEFRPWSAWPLFMMYVIVGLLCMVVFAPWVKANQFYEKLAINVAESIDGDFLWPPADRTNFLALVANTKVSFTVLSFELSSGYYIAVASLLFGWRATAH